MTHNLNNAVRDNAETHEIVNNFRYPFAITVKDKAIDANILVMGNAKPLNQTLPVAQGAQSR